MSELKHPEIYVRGNVSKNTKSWNKEHTVSIQGEMRIETVEDGLNFWLPAESGQMITLGYVLDALHQQADAANEREIKRQQSAAEAVLSELAGAA